VAAVHLDQPLDDGQAKSETAVRAGARGVGLAERLEDVRQEVRLDADTRVAHDDLVGQAARGEA
jgi:hypothetical protein